MPQKGFSILSQQSAVAATLKFWVILEGKMGQKWPLKKDFLKCPNHAESDIYIKQMSNTLYLVNVSDKKWSLSF